MKHIISLFSLYQQFYFSFNNIEIRKNFAIHPYACVMGFLCIFACVLLLFIFFRKGRMHYVDIKKAIMRSCVVAAAIFMFVEINIFFVQSSCCYIGKQFNVKYANRSFYLAKNFSNDTKKVLPQRCTAQLITDRDLTQAPWGYIFRALAYHLYPIDIRGVRPGQKECFIFFDKKQWQESVPSDFLIVKFTETEGVAYRKALKERQ